jgi:hypothetical protein
MSDGPFASSYSRVQRLIQRARTWQEIHGSSVSAGEHQYVDKAMQDGTLTSLVRLATSTETFGLVYGSRGCLRVLDGDEQGWSDIAGAIACYLWSVRLGTKSYYSWALADERRGRAHELCSTLRQATGLLCHFVAVGDRACEDEVWSLVERPLHDEQPAVRHWWQERLFEPFFIRLYARTRGCEVPVDIGCSGLGVYQSVHDAWDDDDRLSRSLATACDYHLEWTENTRDRDAEFRSPPFSLIPFEIHAVNRLRTDSGLRAVEVDHPLMRAVPWPPVAAPFPEELSDTLYKVIVKHDEFFRKR